MFTNNTGIDGGGGPNPPLHISNGMADDNDDIGGGWRSDGGMSSSRSPLQTADKNCGRIIIQQNQEQNNNCNPSPTPSFSVRGAYRRKHTLRALFRSLSLVFLVGGYALYHHFNSGDGGVSSNTSLPPQSLRTGEGIISPLKKSAEENLVDDKLGVVGFTRILQGDSTSYEFDIMPALEAALGDGGSEVVLSGRNVQSDNGSDTAVEGGSAEQQTQEPNQLFSEANVQAENSNNNAVGEEAVVCPELQSADPSWLAVFYTIGILYMFLALAIVCDEFFVPALEEISSEHHLNLSMDVAGATLMAAGGSAPELFTNFVGTFQESDIGIGTIVGSAVFNVLFVIGMCSLLSKEVLTLTWWPLFRDCFYYGFGLIVLSLLAGVLSSGSVKWWESLILLLLYVGYVTLMFFNRRLYKKLTGKELVLASEESEETAPEEDGGESTENGNGVTAAVPVGVGGGADMNGSGGTEATSLTSRGENGKGAPPSPPSSDDFVESLQVSKKSDSRRSIQLIPDSPAAGCPKGVSQHFGGRRNESADFRWPGTFRAGVLKLLLHPESFEEKGGIGIVAKISGDVDQVFKQIDGNGDGTIDKEELGHLFRKLGHAISDEDLTSVFSSLDLDGNGSVSILVWV